MQDLSELSEIGTNAIEPGNITDSLGILGPVAEKFVYVMNIAKIFLGGIFGIYLILLIMKYFESKKLNKTLTSIDQNLKDIKKDINAIKRNARKKHHSG